MNDQKFKSIIKQQFNISVWSIVIMQICTAFSFIIALHYNFENTLWNTTTVTFTICTVFLIIGCITLLFLLKKL